MAFTPEWRSGRLVDHVVHLLRERIVEGRYAPGARLDQSRLADELNVGRSVVGEALRTLDREGLVTTTRGRSMRVATGDRSLLLSALEVREAIDGLAARLAAAHDGVWLEAVLHAAIQDQREAAAGDETQRFKRAMIAFHAALIHASHNPLLLGKVALVRWTECFSGLLEPARLAEVIAEHELILASVCRHDPDGAERAARAHVRATIAALEGTRPLACEGAEAASKSTSIPAR
jgi:DNA-binding GntR family transcriptional regulator